jgi:hypothetical protein
MLPFSMLSRLSLRFVLFTSNPPPLRHLALPALPFLSNLCPTAFNHNCFRIRTYEKSVLKSFGIRTSKTKHLKPFRIRTYRKTPGGSPPPRPPTSTAALPNPLHPGPRPSPSGSAPAKSPAGFHSSSAPQFLPRLRAARFAPALVAPPPSTDAARHAIPFSRILVSSRILLPALAPAGRRIQRGTLRPELVTLSTGCAAPSGQKHIQETAAFAVALCGLSTCAPIRIAEESFLLLVHGAGRQHAFHGSRACTPHTTATGCTLPAQRPRREYHYVPRFLRFASLANVLMHSA